MARHAESRREAEEPGPARLREVTRVVAGQATTEGAGVRLTRMIGTPELDALDPFLLLDEFKSDRAEDYARGFPEHPHRGFETVTYMLAGAMHHEDHKGHAGDVVAGGVQWMTAGRGIVHSEMPRQRDGLMWGLQLWLNLPAKDKMTAPRYQEIAPDRIPEWSPARDVRVRVIAGDSGSARGPVEGVATAPLYLDVSMDAHARFEHPVPAGEASFVHVLDGEGRVGVTADAAGTRVARGHLAVLGPGDAVRVETDDAPMRFVLLAARPLREPIARYGPFVMNTREQIVQAVQDYGAGKFED